MNCPNCIKPLLLAERQGVEVDYCPHCRGVWLDRGELDKIIERSSMVAEPVTPRDASRENVEKRRKTSFLGELFDF